MGIFDSDFDIEKYIRQRIPELDNLENRELLKAIVGNSTLELYNHIKEEYAAHCAPAGFNYLRCPR